jgi:hypothetical protein
MILVYAMEKFLNNTLRVTCSATGAGGMPCSPHGLGIQAATMLFACSESRCTPGLPAKAVSDSLAFFGTGVGSPPHAFCDTNFRCGNKTAHILGGDCSEILKTA